jgi:hypothetical protein
MIFRKSVISAGISAVGTFAMLSLPNPGLAASDNVPDLGGLWSFPQCADGRFSGCTVLAEDDPRLTERALAYAAVFDEAAQPKYDCAPMPIPHMWTDPYSFRIEQLEDRVLIYYGKDDVVRTVWLEGSDHTEPAINEFLYFGHSDGHYEDGVLVVETSKFTFDPQGLNADFRIPSSTQKKLTERFSRDGDRLVLEASTVDTFFLKEPWNFTVFSTPVETLDANWTCELNAARRSLMFEISKYPDDPEPVRIDY